MLIKQLSQNNCTNMIRQKKISANKEHKTKTIKKTKVSVKLI